MTFSRTIAAAAVITVACASVGSAATLTINSVSGIWQNDVPDAGVTGEGTDSIRWGNSTGQGQSGYDFDGAAPPAFNANEATDIILGEFNHINYPVTGTTLQSVDLLVTINVAGYGNINSLFSFTHEETPNQTPCSYPSTTPCSDRVTATLNLGSSDTFMIGGVEYVFDVVGFQHGGGTLSSFITQEGQENKADLIGRFVTKTSVVPLPAAGLLLIGGLGGLGALRTVKRKRNT